MQKCNSIPTSSFMSHNILKFLSLDMHVALDVLCVHVHGHASTVPKYIKGWGGGGMYVTCASRRCRKSMNSEQCFVRAKV